MNKNNKIHSFTFSVPLQIVEYVIKILEQIFVALDKRLAVDHTHHWKYGADFVAVVAIAAHHRIAACQSFVDYHQITQVFQALELEELTRAVNKIARQIQRLQVGQIFQSILYNNKNNKDNNKSVTNGSFKAYKEKNDAQAYLNVEFGSMSSSST